MADPKKKTRTKKKTKKVDSNGVVHIKATFNNTVITVTDNTGKTISWGTAGKAGFKGSKKSTPFAAQTTAETAARKAMEDGLREVHVFVKGPGIGRESAIRSLGGLGLRVRVIKDITPIPHNGCRPQKSRRV